MDKKEFMRLFVFLSAAYSHQEIRDQTIDVYFTILGDLPADLLQAAILKSISENETNWMPSPGAIRAAANELRRAASGQISGIEAYGVLRRTSRFDDLPDDIKAAVMAIGGWRAWGMSDEGCAATRARFIQAYETIDMRQRDQVEQLPAVKRAIQQLAAGMLLGDGSNNHKGFENGNNNHI